MKLEFFADGAALPYNPGFGGCGVVVVHRDHWLLRSLYVGPMVTNNQAELRAVAEAIRLAKALGVSGYVIMTDSKYAAGTVTGLFRATKNIELIVRIRKQWFDAGQPRIQWVKGHAGNILQEVSDRLANLAATERGNMIKTVTAAQGREMCEKILTARLA